MPRRDHDKIPDDPSALYASSLIKTVIVSFGHLHGQPPSGDGLLLDLRNQLRNPADDPRMIEMTGLDRKVRQHVLATRGARELVEETATKVRLLLDGYADERLRRVDVFVGCQGGRHRSVAIAEEVAAHLRAAGIGVEVEHRDVDKPVVRR